MTDSGKSFAPRPAIEHARKAVMDYLLALPEVRGVEVTKLARLDAEKGSWEAEAEVSLPNATLKGLRLPLAREVLEQKTYLVRLSGDLQVEAYGLRESVSERE